MRPCLIFQSCVAIDQQKKASKHGIPDDLLVIDPYPINPFSILRRYVASSIIPPNLSCFFSTYGKEKPKAKLRNQNQETPHHA
jgi:hypothetical protein